MIILCMYDSQNGGIRTKPRYQENIDKVIPLGFLVALMHHVTYFQQYKR